MGADPTGQKDSWEALNAALGVCLNQSKLSPNGNFPGDTSFGNGHAVRDMGGCNIDLSGGEYTLLAPANSAFDKHNNEVGTPITADVLKYHVIEGKKTMDALNSDQKTLNGGTLTAYRKFRKNWLDGAIIGLKSEGPSKSSNWPSDVECDNGIIQAIDTVLVPGAYEGPR